MDGRCLQFLFTFAGILLVKGDTDQYWMEKILRSHFSKTRHHVTNPQYKIQAMQFIRDQFREYGLETHIDVFPTRLTNVTGKNIIGILKGKNVNTDDDVIVGIAAHYDTMRKTPGVDDNGAAVVAMLQAAKKVSSQPYRENTVIFVAFDFEEWEDVSKFPNAACAQLSCGSRHFINTWVHNFWSSIPAVAGVMVMDTIMNFDETRESQKLPANITLTERLFPTATENIVSNGKQGDFLAVIGRPADAKILNTFVNQFKQQAQPKYKIQKFSLSMLKTDRLTLQQFYNPLLGDFMRSDHVVFWMATIPAIFITDTANLRGYMKNCYHQSCDAMYQVTDDTIGFAVKTAKALAATVNQFSPPLPGGPCINSGHRYFPEVFLVLTAICGKLII